MKAKQSIMSVVVCLLMAALSCGVGQALKEMGEVGLAIQEEFGHEASVGMQWNNDVRSWTISFTRFDISDLEHQELNDMAEDVYHFLLDEFGKAENQDYIIVRFSPEDEIDEYTREKAEFRFDN